MHSQVISQGISGGKYVNRAFDVVKHHRGVKVYLHVFLNSKLVRGVGLVHTPVPLLTREQPLVPFG